MIRRVRLEKTCRPGNWPAQAKKRANRPPRASAAGPADTGCSSIPAVIAARLTAWSRRSDLLETIADAVERLDHVELGVNRLELLAEPLDVAVDGPVVDIDLVVIGRIHQRIAALHDAGPVGERVEDQELRHG